MAVCRTGWVAVWLLWATVALVAEPVTARAEETGAHVSAVQPFDPTIRAPANWRIPERPSWSLDVVPALTRAGCSAGACHGSFQGRGGLRLSLLGYDPRDDYETVVLASNGRRLNLSAPNASLLLRKATGSIPHGGGARIARDSPTAMLLERFLEQGASPDPDAVATPITLTVKPAIVELLPGQSASIQSTARFSDGSVRDVTSWSLFDARDEFLCRTNKLGRITAEIPGKSAIMVRYQGLVAVVDVSVRYPTDTEVTGFEPQNFIDVLAVEEWKSLRVAPAPLATDHEFVRRVYGDLIGTLPTPEETLAFVDDRSADKRARLIDRLLERPEYTDYWAVKWGDLLRVHRRYVGEKGLATFSGWLKQALRTNRPLSQMATELLTARGNVYQSGPVSYFFVDERPEQLAETTAQVFLGVRLQCARCHHHPMEIWSQDDYFGLAANFTRLEVKQTQELGSQGRYGGIKILRVARTVPENRKLPRPAQPKPLGAVAFELKGEGDDPREQLAAWLVAPENPFFARNFANRYWSYLFGQGLVEQVDDLRDTNPATLPKVLDALASDFQKSGYDLKHLVRTICNSRVYQSASVLVSDRDRDGRMFTHRTPRQLPAEVLLDAVNRIVGVPEMFAGIPEGTRAIELLDPAIPSDFLTTFGRPQRNSPCECARTSQPNLAQALQLVNSEQLQKKLASENGRLSKWVTEKRSDQDMVRDLFLWCYSRPPRDDELTAAVGFVATENRREALEDLLWTLLNSSEFVFSH